MVKEIEITEMKTPIDFLTVANGGIRMYADGIRVGWGTTAKEIAEVIETAGLSETIYASSSMEFATEDGFKTNDGAWVLWNKAKDLYLWGE
jgi:hypothetical protein